MQRNAARFAVRACLWACALPVIQAGCGFDTAPITDGRRTPHREVVDGGDSFVDGSMSSDAMQSDASVGSGCVPNTTGDTLGCPEICAEACNGLDDDCDQKIDESADDSCMLVHAQGACLSGVCVQVGCEDGFLDCDGDPTTGCEVQADSLEHCGQCGNVCDIANASETCVAGQCTLVACDVGFADCDGTRSQCETSLDTLTDCGGCGVTCAGSHATTVCSSGVCEVVACDLGHADCDLDDQNGCEVALDAPSSCGGCPGSAGHIDCTGLPNVATAGCAFDTCQVLTCAADFLDCDGEASNGCERQLSVGGACSPGDDCTVESFGSHTYFFCTQPQTFAQARTRCKTQRLGDLVRIDDADENAFVADQIAQSSWIGASDAAFEGDQRWVDSNVSFWSGDHTGQAVSGAYAAWDTGEPDSTSDCAAISDAGQGAWLADSCDTQRGFVCEVQSDTCPSDSLKHHPGVCGCGVPDTDADGDGTADCLDACPDDPSKVAAGVCGCGVADADSDADGTHDCNETCDLDPLKLAPGACGCGTPDTNSDGDAQPDCNETCDLDPLKLAPGACGCDTPDTDSDGDATPDCNDACELDPLKLAPGACGCGTPDSDSDADGTPDCNDACALDPLKLAPGACGCGMPDSDSDGDGTPDCNDGCPAHAEKTAPGVCGCAVLDTDTDGDDTPDCNDGCPAHAEKTAPGVCGCAVLDTDTDGDGAADCEETCDGDPDKTEPGVCGCGTSDADTDGDGTLDCNDACRYDAAHTAGTCAYGYTPANIPSTTDFTGAPALAVSCNATLNTSSAATVSICGTSVTPVLQSQTGGPELWILRLSSLTVDATRTLTIRGTRPVVLAVVGDATIAGTIDVGASGSTRGAGGDHSGCAASGQGVNGTRDTDDDQGDGGGGGGGFGSAGGAGGRGYAGQNGSAGGTVSSNLTLSPLRGGCRGGGVGGGMTSGGGAGGGALQLAVGGKLTLSASAVVSAGGGGGQPGSSAEDAGAGGGSGGGLLLEGYELQIHADAWLAANGGGGASGNATNSANGNPGSDASRTSTTPAAGGTASLFLFLWPGNGGQGAALGGAATAGSGASILAIGSEANRGAGGGGGGGGFGLIRMRSVRSPCVQPTARVTPAALTSCP